MELFLKLIIANYQLLIIFAANFRPTSGEIRECCFEKTLLNKQK